MQNKQHLDFGVIVGAGEERGGSPRCGRQESAAGECAGPKTLLELVMLQVTYLIPSLILFSFLGLVEPQFLAAGNVYTLMPTSKAFNCKMSCCRISRHVQVNMQVTAKIYTPQEAEYPSIEDMPL